MTKLATYIYDMHRLWTGELSKAETSGDPVNIAYCRAKVETYDSFVMGMKLKTFEDVVYAV